MNIEKVFAEIDSWDAGDVCTITPVLKHRLFQLGLLKSAHALDEFQGVLGFDVAEQMMENR